jgi:hypothetical protein
LSKDSWLVAVDVEESVGPRMRAEPELGEIHGPQSRSLIAESRELMDDFAGDVFLGLLSRAANVGGEDHVFFVLKEGMKGLPFFLGFLGKDIDGGSPQMALVKSFGEGFMVNNHPSTCVDKIGIGFHLSELFCTNETPGLGCVGNVETQEIYLGDELFE